MPNISVKISIPHTGAMKTMQVNFRRFHFYKGKRNMISTCWCDVPFMENDSRRQTKNKRGMKREEREVCVGGGGSCPFVLWTRSRFLSASKMAIAELRSV